MKKMIVFALLASGIACGDATTEDDDFLDEEFGTVDFSKADNGAIRPGSREAIATLQFVNQAIADDAAADAFYTLLDSKLHRIAARNIVDYRKGEDGDIGTADDRQFANLNQLDGVRFVGRVAMIRLFELAKDAGFFGPPVSCNEVLNLRNRDITLSTLEQLVEIENSGCDHFERALTIDFRNTILPSYRDLNALDSVTEVRGLFRVTSIAALENPVMRGLTKAARIDGSLMAADVDQNMLPVIEEVDDLNLNREYPFDTVKVVGDLTVNVETANQFPVLETATTIRISANDAVEGYDVLKTVDSLSITDVEGIDGFSDLETARVISITSGLFAGEQHGVDLEMAAFGKLTDVNSLTLNMHNNLLRDTPANFANTIVVDGFDQLLTMQALTTNTHLTADFPKLEAISTLTIRDRSGRPALFTGQFDALETAGNIQTAVVEYPFPELVTVTGSMTVRGGTRVRASKLETVGGTFNVDVKLSRFNELVSTGHATFVCETGTWSGANAFTEFRSLNLQTADCDFGGFEALDVNENSISISIGESGDFKALQNLIAIGTLAVTDRAETDDLFPALELIDGTLTLTGPKATGFDALDAIEGNLRISDALSITGLDNLRSVGGTNISLPREMTEVDRDAFLDQIDQFSGTITTN